MHASTNEKHDTEEYEWVDYSLDTFYLRRNVVREEEPWDPPMKPSWCLAG